MHHPGPPRFVAAGDEVELAPRDPDPTATYTWRVANAPPGSTATVGDDPVEHFQPDLPGTYRVKLTAPDGTHTLTIRAYPGHMVGGGSGGAYGRSGDATETESTPAAGGESGERTSAREDSGTTPDGPGGRPRVSLSASVEDGSVGDGQSAGDGQVVVRADARGHPDGPETAADLEIEFLLDDRDALERDDVTIEGPELRIPRERLPDLTRVHAVAIGRHGYSVPDAVEIERERASGDGAVDDPASDTDSPVTVRRPYHPPGWTQDAVIYEIYVRTFPDRDGERGAGDRTVLDAIADRLDYIAELGVDTLWLTPVLENDHAPHGYNVTDFFAIAEDLGTREDYEEFVAAANERGLRVLFDLVCNHSARAHPFFQAAVADPSSEYREWYEWRTETEPETYFDWEYIANFDFDHLPVRRHLLDAVDEWAPLVDGFRCDMAWAVPDGFWREIHARLKARDSEFLLLDETIPYIPDFQAGLFDVHFDSTTYAALRRVGNGEPAAAVLDAIDERTRIGFPDHAGFMLYAENHDETRYISECGRPAARAALGALFTLPGAPMVYAGQEFGQRGKRDDLAWAHADETLREHVQRLAAVRTDRPALSADADLQRVRYEVVDGAPAPVVAFAREREQADGRGDGSIDGSTDERLIVVLNFADGPATVAVGPAEGAGPVTDRTDILTGESVATAEGVRVDDVVVLRAAGDAPSNQ